MTPVKILCKIGTLESAHRPRGRPTSKNPYISTISSRLAILSYILVHLLAKQPLQPFKLQFLVGVAAIKPLRLPPPQ